ncbi:MAG: sulfotransferase domain-containing protein [Bacillota bacterium]
MDTIKPNFLIVGAAKAGTTSLYHWLKQHPDVFMPYVKEPSFFVQDYGISVWEEYLSLFEPGRGKKAIGEASTAYLTAPESPRWIRQILGDVKIIILLRNPAQRALSLYAWMVMEGYEWLPAFEYALIEEERRFLNESFRFKNPEYFWDYMYFRSGLYYEQVKRYIDTFGNELIKIYLFEDLIGYPSKIYSDVCRFLEVSNEFRPIFTPQNPSKIPRFIKLQHLLFELKRSGRLPRPLCSSIQQLITLNVKLGLKPKMPPSLQKKLQEMYRKDIEKLSQLINKDLSHWLC